MSLPTDFSRDLSNEKEVSLKVRRIRTPEEVCQRMCYLAAVSENVLYVLPLDAQSRLIGEPITMSLGSHDDSEIRCGEILRTVHEVGAITFAIAYVRPSGDVTISEVDTTLTECLVAKSRHIGIPLVDYVVMPNSGFNGFSSVRREHKALWS